MIHVFSLRLINILNWLGCQTESRYVQTEMNAQGGVVRSKLHRLEKKWTHDSLDLCNFERTIVWTYAILNAR